MDFGFSEVQDEIRTLARQLLTAEVTQDRLKALTASDDRFDKQTWDRLVEANLVGLALPESAGGSGLGLLDLAVVLEEVGRATAFVPLLASAGQAGLAIAELGTEAQQSALLPGIVDGSSLTVGAFDEPVADDPNRPRTSAVRVDGGWRLSGTKSPVAWATLAARVLVTATTDSGAVALFLVDPAGEGARLSNGVSTSFHPASELELDGYVVPDSDVLGDPTTSDAATWAFERALACNLAVALGNLTRDLELTAEYTSQREVFGKPIATYQGPALRLADAYIDLEASRVTVWSALWRLSEGLPASDALSIAKFWLADGGHRVVHTAQHLHGGIGVDTDYPLHRHFVLDKELEFSLGGATQHLLRLGQSIVSAQ